MFYCGGRLSLVWRAMARYYFFLHPWNFWSITIWFDGLLSLVGFFRGYVFLAKQCATLSLHAFRSSLSERLRRIRAYCPQLFASKQPLPTRPGQHPLTGDHAPRLIEREHPGASGSCVGAQFPDRYTPPNNPLPQKLKKPAELNAQQAFPSLLHGQPGWATKLLLTLRPSTNTVTNPQPTNAVAKLNNTALPI